MAFTAQQRDPVHSIERLSIEENGMDALQLRDPRIKSGAVLACGRFVHNVTPADNRQYETPRSGSLGVWPW